MLAHGQSERFRACSQGMESGGASVHVCRCCLPPAEVYKQRLEQLIATEQDPCAKEALELLETCFWGGNPSAQEALAVIEAFSWVWGPSGGSTGPSQPSSAAAASAGSATVPGRSTEGSGSSGSGKQQAVKRCGGCGATDGENGAVLKVRFWYGGSELLLLLVWG